MTQVSAGLIESLDTGITSLKRQFEEVNQLSEAVRAIDIRVYSPNGVLESLSSYGFVLSSELDNGHDQIKLIKVDLSLLQKSLQSLINCLNRRVKGARIIEINSNDSELCFTIPTFDSSIVENSMVAPYAIEILERMGARVNLRKDAVAILFKYS